MSNPTSENPNLADTLLFEQFAMFATASAGIGRLRDLILQLAVQGRRHPLRRDVTDVFFWIFSALGGQCRLGGETGLT
jgi:hypothetical protein